LGKSALFPQLSLPPSIQTLPVLINYLFIIFFISLFIYSLNSSSSRFTIGSVWCLPN
jgi:hypothetical protein